MIWRVPSSVSLYAASEAVEDQVHVVGRLSFLDQIGLGLNLADVSGSVLQEPLVGLGQGRRLSNF